MNIFILDNDPTLAAQYQCDKHVVKMVLETAQLLCSVCHLLGQPAPYKLTHKNHPCTLWTLKTVENFQWLREHGLALAKEYTHRYGKVHKSQAVIEGLACPPLLLKHRLTPFAQAMPEHYMHHDAVVAYRAYYIGEKARFARWTNREIPAWWSSN